MPSVPDPAHPERLSQAELAAWRGMLRVYADVIRDLDGQLEAEHGLPLSSYEVLLTLADTPGHRVRMAELARSVLLSRSGLTRMCDRLERDGLVERHGVADDGRGSYAVITPAGLELFAAARRTHLAGVRERFTNHFDADELERLGALWERVLPGAAAQR